MFPSRGRLGWPTGSGSAGSKSTSICCTLTGRGYMVLGLLDGVVRFETWRLWSGINSVCVDRLSFIEAERCPIWQLPRTSSPPINRWPCPRVALPSPWGYVVYFSAPLGPILARSHWLMKRKASPCVRNLCPGTRSQFPAAVSEFPGFFVGALSPRELTPSSACPFLSDWR